MTWPGVPEIAVSELPDEPVLVDVREADEWAAGHAPDAVHIPMGEIAARLDDIPDADQIYVICRTGARSARVTAFLNDNGWDAVNVSGGMMVWTRMDKPLVSETGNAPEIL